MGTMIKSKKAYEEDLQRERKAGYLEGLTEKDLLKASLAESLKASREENKVYFETFGRATIKKELARLYRDVSKANFLGKTQVSFKVNPKFEWLIEAIEEDLRLLEFNYFVGKPWGEFLIYL